MKKYIFIFFLIFLFISASDLFPQRLKRSGRIQQNSNILFSEVYQIPAKDSSKLFYIYKIPYNKLVFEKDGNQYKAAYRFTVEIVDSNKKFVVRQIKEKDITVDSFEKTTSTNEYSSGVFAFNLAEANYYLLPFLADKNSDREGKLNEFPIYSKDFKTKLFLEPVIVYNKKVDCDNSGKYAIPNFNGSIPFDKNSYDLLIPANDSSLTNIFVTLINNKDTVFNKIVSNELYANLGFKECRDKIVLNNKINKETKFFVINNFNKDLIEGKLTISISKSKGYNSKEKFVKAVNWFNKPFSLRNPEFAIKSLKYIEKEKVIDSLLDLDEKDYRTALFKYWKKYDPTPETSFNELMDEYYSRVDYAAKNFRSITGMQGFNTDRGKIFIQFGKPNKIERNSNSLGYIVETWIYKKPERKFIFVDKTGTGDYQLKSG